MNRHITLAITGASGAVYGLNLGRELLKNGFRLSVMISRPGFSVLETECGLRWSGEPGQVATRLHRYFQTGPEQLHYYATDDFTAPLASGSSPAEAMILCPCSMGSLARIAAGLSGNLIERAADVTIKEGKPLLLVPRETPLSAIHLENMLKLARLGVRIVPAMPGFYGQPQAVDDLVNFMTARILDSLGIANDLSKRWGEQ
jgi:4-hydroxy-3-polyprenylbenzoate decarboxylase